MDSSKGKANSKVGVCVKIISPNTSAKIPITRERCLALESSLILVGMTTKSSCTALNQHNSIHGYLFIIYSQPEVFEEAFSSNGQQTSRLFFIISQGPIECWLLVLKWVDYKLFMGRLRVNLVPVYYGSFHQLGCGIWVCIYKTSRPPGHIISRSIGILLGKRLQ